MSLQDDIKRDWEAMDGIEYATITAKSYRGLSDVTCTTTPILRRALTHNAMKQMAGVIFDPKDIVIDVWDYRASPLATVQSTLGREVQEDDTITLSGGTVYRIKLAMYSPMTSRWRCQCYREQEE